MHMLHREVHEDDMTVDWIMTIKEADQDLKDRLSHNNHNGDIDQVGRPRGRLCYVSVVGPGKASTHQIVLCQCSGHRGVARRHQ